MKPLIIIPARMASVRLPGKPLADIGGAPMIVRVWERAVEAACGEVVVACDGEAIKNAVELAGGRAVVTPADLPSGSDRIWDALNRIDPHGDCDAIINVQGDMPTLDARIIHSAFAALQESDADIVTLASVIHDEKEIHDPAVVKVAVSHQSSLAGKKSGDRRPESGRALYFSRSPIPYGEGNYYHHIGIYAYRRKALERFVNLPPSPLEKREKLEQLRALEAGMRIDVAIVDVVPLGVDTSETLEKARKMMSGGR